MSPILWSMDNIPPWEQDTSRVKMLREELSKKDDMCSYQLNYELLEKLLQGDNYGALNPNCEIFFDNRSGRPLHFFARWGDKCALILFIKYKADPTMVDSKKRTPLHVAACHGHTDIARTLVENSTNQIEYLAMHDDEGLTALHNTAVRNDLTMCIFLLNKKASPNILDNDKKTALNLAVEKRCTATIAQLLIKHGTDLICKDKLGLTPLDTASGHYYQDSDLVKCLIEQLFVLKNDPKKHILYVVHCSQDVKNFVKTLFILLKIV